MQETGNLSGASTSVWTISSPNWNGHRREILTQLHPHPVRRQIWFFGIDSGIVIGLSLENRTAEIGLEDCSSVSVWLVWRPVWAVEDPNNQRRRQQIDYGGVVEVDQCRHGQLRFSIALLCCILIGIMGLHLRDQILSDRLHRFRSSQVGPLTE